MKNKSNFSRQLFSFAVLVFLFAWQLPQQLAGMLVWLVMYRRRKIVNTVAEGPLLLFETRNIGLSLGWFVFWTPLANRFPYYQNDCLMHEKGHAKQSVLLGPFYLFVVGIPSIIRSAYSKFYFIKNGRSWQKYYASFPENWADKLGGIVKKA